MKRLTVGLRICLFLSVLLCVAVGHGAAQEAGDTPMAGMQVESGFIDVDNGKLYYEKAGEGPCIVFIHDGLVHHQVWDAQFPVFARQYTVVRYDRRGYGKSPQPTTRYSNIEDLHRVITQLGIDNTMLVGMSAGGGLCIDYTLAHPDKVNTMILVGAVVSGMPYTQHMYTRGGRRQPGDIALVEQQIDYWLEEDPYEVWRENKTATKRLLDVMRDYHSNAKPDKGRLHQPPSRPALGALSEIKVPTLLLVGEYDVPDCHAHAGAIQAGIAGAKRLVAPHAAHLVPLEQPEWFNRTVLDFLVQVDFWKVLDESGPDAAAALYQRLKSEKPERAPFAEGEMNNRGYTHLQNGDIDGALALFKLNVKAYPDSWNVYDSYGEALLQKGDTAAAADNYRKSVALNPQNAAAAKLLEQIGGSSE